MPWTLVFADKRLQAALLRLQPGRCQIHSLCGAHGGLWTGSWHAAHPRAGGRSIRAPPEGARRNRPSVLLYLEGSADRDAASLCKEVFQDSAQRAGARARAASEGATLKTVLSRFRSRALRNPAVRKAYDGLEDEFAFLDEVLRARARSGLTQADVAARVGTTQSAIARLESGTQKHSPSIATLQRYARAIGFRLEIRLVESRRPTADRRRGARTSVSR